MKISIKHKKKKIVYVVEITDKDVASTYWPKSELEMLKRKNSSVEMSDILYGLQIQARNIEQAKGFCVSKKRGVFGGRTLLRSSRKC